jgi:hypothetical protein
LEERQWSREFKLLVARFLCSQEVSTAAREPGLQLGFSNPSLRRFCCLRMWAAVMDDTEESEGMVKSRVDLVGFRAELSIKSGAPTLP